MNNLTIFLWFIFGLKEAIAIQTRCDCSPRTRTRNPRNSNKTISNVTGEIGNPVVLECCVDGFIDISWIKASQTRINCSDNRYTCFKNNTCLTIKNLKKESFGKYICEARGDLNKSISIPITLRQGCTIIVSPKVTITHIEDNGNVHQNKLIKKCATAEFEASKNPSVLVAWVLPNKQQADETTNFRFGHMTLVKKTKKIDDCTYKDIYKACLYIRKMKKEYIGNYTCCFIGGDTTKHIFYFGIDEFSIPRWVIYITVASIAFLCIIVLIWYCYYDIMLIKTRKQKNENKKTHNIMFIYDTKSEKMLELVHKLCVKLENYGLVTYFYDRDKTMGKTILEEYQTATDNSNAVVYILSPDMLNREDLLFAARENLDRTIVIYYPSQKKVKKIIPKLPDNYRPLFEEIIKTNNKWTLGSCQFLCCFCCKRRFIQWIRYQERMLSK